MKAFPMFIRTTNRRVVVVGGGEQAAQKTRLLLKTDAQIVILSDALDDELEALRDDGRITQETGTISLSSFSGAAMSFIATGCPGIDAALHAIAKDAGTPVNVVDQPDLCDITTPSIVDRDPVVIAIGTEGTAPVLARRIKTQMEETISPSLGSFASLAGRLRPAVTRNLPRGKRRAFWAWAFKGAPWETHKRGAEREASAMLKTAIQAGGPPRPDQGGSIALVGAGPGAKDLLTLRAVERLQEADVIFYDRLVDPGVLELARRDAERVFVGKVVGATAWPQNRICDVIVAAAAQGQKVVRLKSGDPMLFGRAAEELDAASRANIPVEVVPGVTAALAAASTLKTPLTARGQTDAVTLCTAQNEEGSIYFDWADRASPGHTMVVYMGVAQASRMSGDLIAKGYPCDLPVTVAADVSKSQQKVLDTTLGTLCTAIEQSGIKGCALIIMSIPRDIQCSVETKPTALSLTA